MTLNSSGPISLGGSTTGQSIALELGQSATGQISLNDSSVRTLAGVPTGAIVMPLDFWGKSSAGYYFAINNNATSTSTIAQQFGFTNPDSSVTTQVYDAGINSYVLLKNSGDNGSILSSNTITTQLNSPSKDTSNNIYTSYGTGIVKLNSSYATQIAKALSSVSGLYASYCCVGITSVSINSSGVDSSNNVWASVAAYAYPPCCYCYPLSPNYSTALAKLDTSLNSVSTYLIPMNPWYDACYPVQVNFQMNNAFFPSTNPTPNLVLGLTVALYNWYSCGYPVWAEIIIGNSPLTNFTRYLFKGYNYGSGAYDTYIKDLTRDSSGNTYAVISSNQAPLFTLYKITTGGAFIPSTINFGSNTPYYAKIAIDSSGNIYVAMQYAYGTALGICIVKYNSSLTVQWIRNLVQTSPTPTGNLGLFVSGLSISSSTTQPGLVLNGMIRPTSTGIYQDFIMTLPFDGSLTQSFTLSGITFSYAVYTGVTFSPYGFINMYVSSSTVASGSSTFSSDSFTVTPTTGYSTAVKIL